MIFIFFKTAIKFFFKEEYPRWYGVVIELLSVLLMLATFWFTSKAFSPVGLNRQDYFHYLIIGELSLHIPFAILFQGVRFMKRLGLSSLADQLIVAEKSILIFVLHFLAIYFVKSLLRIFFILALSGLFFSFPMDGKDLLTLVFLQVFAFFPVSLLSLSVGSLVLFWGRGESIWGQLSSWLSFLSGAYFPLQVFPSWIGKVLPLANPFTFFLQLSRRALSDGFNSIDTFNILIFVGWTFFFFAALVVVFKLGLRRYQRVGPPNSYSF